ncbi:hypothetical protein A946_07880 [Methylacidiphilum kamchatkense Kam1]|uniref:Uncharacterized protein n=1 Tax=Methylacidiphilum kamchatkense Kam1 TaxID=1202785 RepID=A0A0C1UPR0_9BACT|nr:hypothetical protein [Methylacidiphilum kamchatkense]KIE58394.1 hypothetical protein A946_07880 [Methylacidiphilum kamchatkense Kam1]QDQ42199.1 hypothetical protein kam1_966 [Methylacidiphilum kamchatkense Kam1]
MNFIDNIFNNSFKIILMAGLFLYFCGCVHTNYFPYHGDGIQEGKGGGKRVIQGIEVWSDGLPNKKYKIIGVIHDERSGLFSSGLIKDVVKKAKSIGADGVIEYQAYAVAANQLAAAAAGFGTNAMYFPQSYGSTMGSWLPYAGPASAGLSGAQSGQSRWWVFKYIRSQNDKKEK